MTDPTCETCRHFGPWPVGAKRGNCYIKLPPQIQPDYERDSAVFAEFSCSLHAPIPETDRTSD